VTGIELKKDVMKQATGERSADIDLGYIDLNTASEQDLANIPWIGQERARELIQHRPFKHMDDVRRVPGFSEDITDQLVRGGALVGDPTPAGGK
jgi:DNA uptake protein ComE-like DNA-binding protein